MYADWCEVERTKKKGDKCEKIMSDLGKKLEDGKITFDSAVNSWDARIAEIEKEMDDLEAKLNSLNDKLDEAKVNNFAFM